MFDSLSPLLRDIVNALLIAIAGLLVAIILSFLFSRLSRKTWGRYIGNLVALTVVLYTAKLILDVAGGAGVVVILGTALTGALVLGSENFASDIVSGLKLFTIRPFKSGDIIQLGDGTLGEVDHTTLTYTALRDDMGNRIIVRNSEVAAGKIVNYSAFPVRRVEVRLVIPVMQDLEKAVAIIKEALKDFSPESGQEKTQPGVVAEFLWNGSMKLTVYACVAGRLDMDAVDEAKNRLMLVVVQALKKQGIALVPRQA